MLAGMSRCVLGVLLACERGGHHQGVLPACEGGGSPSGGAAGM